MVRGQEINCKSANGASSVDDCATDEESAELFLQMKIQNSYNGASLFFIKVLKVLIIK